MMPLKTLAKTAALLAAALLATAAAKPAPKTAPPKPAATSTSPKPTPAVPTDAQSPPSLMEILGSLDAKAEIATHDADNVVLKVTSPAGGFQVQFAGCNAQGRGCQALQFDAAAEQRTATLGEINAFNQSSLTCRIYQDRASSKPHILYSALVFPGTTRADMLVHIAAWRGCLANFGDFLKGPAAYLSSAP